MGFPVCADVFCSTVASPFRSFETTSKVYNRLCGSWQREGASEADVEHVESTRRANNGRAPPSQAWAGSEAE